MTYESEFSRLNEYQKEAVFDDSEACIVNANVGSGKTTVLISKIIYLHYEKQVDYKDMIVLTFTNKAANEIKERLLKLDNKISAEELDGFGTFHSVALNLLKNRLPIEQEGYTKDFAVIEPDEEMDMAMELIQENHLIIKYKNRLKKRLEQEMASVRGNILTSKYKDDIHKLVQLLKEEKKKQNKLTFSDLLSVSNRLLTDYSFKAKWIIVDEAQDTDRIQLEFIEKIKGADTKLFAVGDPNQVIYSWREGSTNTFYLLRNKFSAKELTLPINYRSSTSILQVAKCFLGNRSKLLGIREEGSKIVVKNHYNPFHEAEYMAEKIRDLHNQGVEYREIAVFYRVQNQSHIFERIFKKENIPCEVSLKKTIRDIPVLNWMMRILRFSTNSEDTSSAYYVLTDSFYGENLSETVARKVIKAMKEKKETESKLLERMLHFKEKCSDVVNSKEIYDYFHFDTYIKPTSATYVEDREAIYTLLDIIIEYGLENEMDFVTGLKDFLNSSALYGVNILQKDISNESDSVKLMTLHASKGLEFQYVFIVGINYGLIPLLTRGFEEEEERRLFFVGITRAKDYLELSYYTNPENSRVMSGASRYLDMIPRKLIKKEMEETIEVSLQDLRKEVEEARRNRGKELADNEIDDVDTSLVWVKHEKYGKGTVVSDNDDIIAVNFENYGEKEFVKAFCDLMYL